MKARTWGMRSSRRCRAGIGGDAAQHRVELPRQVGGVAQARAHALAEERRRLVAGVARQQQAPAAPLPGDRRVEGVDRRALNHGILGRDPLRQQRPEILRPDCPVGILARHQHDLPATTTPADMDDGHRLRRVAQLHGVVRQGLRTRRGRVHEQVEHQPGLVQAEILVVDAHVAAHQRARAVAADDVAGLVRDAAHAHRRAGRQAHIVGVLVEAHDLVAKRDGDVGQRGGAVAQRRIEPRLMEVPVVDPALRPDAFRAAPLHQRLAGSVDEAHALGRRPRDAKDGFGQPDCLEDAHHLAVEMHRARQGMDLGIALQHQHRAAGTTQQIGQQGAGRAEADDGDIVEIVGIGGLHVRRQCVVAGRAPAATSARSRAVAMS